MEENTIGKESPARYNVPFKKNSNFSLIQSINVEIAFGTLSGNGEGLEVKINV